MAASDRIESSVEPVLMPVCAATLARGRAAVGVAGDGDWLESHAKNAIGVEVP